MNWYKKNTIAQQQTGVPGVLYHATYRPYLQSIIEKGLVPNFSQTWDISQEGAVYLDISPNAAESYAETADGPAISQEYIDDIIILAIDTNHLDKNLLSHDSNINFDSSGEGVTSFEYWGTIPSSAIINFENISRGGRGI